MEDFPYMKSISCEVNFMILLLFLNVNLLYLQLNLSLFDSATSTMKIFALCKADDWGVLGRTTVEDNATKRKNIVD